MEENLFNTAIKIHEKFDKKTRRKLREMVIIGFTSL